MATISEAIGVALRYQQGGRLGEAERICRDILAVDPDQVDALCLLGGIACQVGQYASAVECYQRAIRRMPELPDAHCNLGTALQELGRFSEAADCFRRSIALKPTLAEAHFNLGNVFRRQGQLNDAVARYRLALQINPGFADAHANLAMVLYEQGDLDESARCYRKALELQPGLAEAHNGLGTVLQRQNKLNDAIEHYRRAVELNPGFAEALSNLGFAYHQRGLLDEAVACFKHAFMLSPEFAEAQNNLGSALQAQGQTTEAMACFRQALQLKPDFAEAYNNLGHILQAQGKLGDAVVAYGHAVRLKPSYAEGLSNLGTVFTGQARMDDAIDCFRRALELKPAFVEARSNLLLAKQYSPGTTLAELAAAHAEYDDVHAEPLRALWRPHDNDRNPDRILRLGFVSADFGRHPIGYFLIGALENLDRSTCETVCYYDRIAKDDMTRRLEATATMWREVGGVSDQQLAEQIRADRIDILFDLAGHTARNRLLVFARKPAPIQITWAGYVGTTGLKAMDYIIADRYEIPSGAERYYVERVLRMPDGYVCYEPPLYAPPVSPLPALGQGFVTLGSFNNRAKLTSQVVDAWAKILLGLPQSRLVLKHKGMDDPSVAESLVKEFAGRGIERERIEYQGWSAHAKLLAEYNRIDLALNPFPYNGGLTTCEALWMGVPVVSCPGETFASRHSLSHLSTVGLTEAIARDVDDYVQLAVQLASDPPRLAALRGGLRERLGASSLCDGKRFAESLMLMLRDVWRQWCHCTIGNGALTDCDDHNESRRSD